MNGFCHIEIPCTDLNRVSKFYGDVFDWKSEHIPAMDYATYKTPEGVGGGFSKQLKPAAKDSGAMLYIMVDNIEDSLKKIETHGGKTLRTKTPIPGIGHFAVFKDIEGNEMALFNPQI